MEDVANTDQIPSVTAVRMQYLQNKKWHRTLGCSPSLVIAAILTELDHQACFDMQRVVCLKGEADLGMAVLNGDLAGALHGSAGGISKDQPNHLAPMLHLVISKHRAVTGAAFHLVLSRDVLRTHPINHSGHLSVQQTSQPFVPLIEFSLSLFL